MTRAFWNRLQHANPRAILLLTLVFLLVSLLWWSDELSPREAVPAPADPRPTVEPPPSAPSSIDIAARQRHSESPRNPFDAPSLMKALQQRQQHPATSAIALKFPGIEYFGMEWFGDEDTAGTPGHPLPETEPTPPPTASRQIEILYRGMLRRTDNSLTAFLDNLTDQTSGFYHTDDVIEGHRIQSIQPRSIRLRSPDGTIATIPINQAMRVGQDQP